MLIELGFTKHMMCFGMFMLYDVAGRFAGFICLHVDDFLGTGDHFFEEKIEELNGRVGFGSVRKGSFEHCGRQYVKEPSGEISINMKPYIENLVKVDISKERAKATEEPLTALENHHLRSANDALQRVAKVVYSQRK